MVGFGGWEMPLSYPSGTIAEHMACRRSAALFDVSHLGTVRVEGSGAFERLQTCLTNDLARISPGKAQYTHLLDDEDGSVLDDIIVWWVDEHRFDVMPNASNTERVLQALGGQDVTSTRAVLAVQGPESRRIVASLSEQAASVGRFAVASFRWRSASCIVAGTGYTGEDGVEIAVPVDEVEAAWEALVQAGAVPAGLGARDTLRLEAGLPLHGHELGPGITPLQAGLSWVVAWSKGPFPGKKALEVERASGVARMIRGVLSATRQPPREGQEVLQAGRVIGKVTSGSFSPVLERGIGLALVDSSIEVGSSVEIDSRGRRLACEIVKPPFHRLARAAA